MTEEQKYLFDLQGYIVVPGVLDAARVQRMLAAMEEHCADTPEEQRNDFRFRDFLQWSDDYRSLIDEAPILPILAELLTPKFRLDHAYGMATGNGGGMDAANEYLHNQAGLFEHGCYYVTHGERLHNGLIVVSYSLTDIKPGAGGFCCIPGSHKSVVLAPKRLSRRDNNPLVQQIPQKADDALIFTEALTHGTWPWTDPDTKRRSILMKYSPAYLQWAAQTMDDSIPGLTDRQRLILQGPRIGTRPPVEI